MTYGEFRQKEMHTRVMRRLPASLTLMLNEVTVGGHANSEKALEALRTIAEAWLEHRRHDSQTVTVQFDRGGIR